MTDDQCFAVTLTVQQWRAIRDQLDYDSANDSYEPLWEKLHELDLDEVTSQEVR